MKKKLEKENRKVYSSEFSFCECGTEEWNLASGHVITLGRRCGNINEEKGGDDDEDAGVSLSKACLFPEDMAFWNSDGFCPSWKYVHTSQFFKAVIVSAYREHSGMQKVFPLHT